MSNLINLFLFILPFLIAGLIFYLSIDNMSVKNIKMIIPKIIHLAQHIEHIKLNIKFFLDETTNNFEIDSDIKSDTFLTYNQYVLLKYIESLEELNNDWEMLKSDSLLNNSLIKSPYIVAYNIREIIKTPIYNDEEGNPAVWLNKDEKLCIKKSKYFTSYENNLANQMITKYKERIEEEEEYDEEYKGVLNKQAIF